MSEVTVVIPSYNHAQFIERTLRSVFAQTLPPKKLIVIDDGSKDESVTVIERALRDCPFDSELIVRENRGVCATLNQGLSLTETPFFAYISSDDLWLPQFLESRMKTIASRPEAILAYGYSLLIDMNDNVTDSTRNWAEYADGNALEMLLYPIHPTSASVLYRTTSLAEVRWNEDSILEDYELYLRLSVRGEFALDNSRPLSAWRIHEYNTSSDFEAMMNEWLAAQDRTRDELGLTETDLALIQSRIKFRCTKDFLRRGNRRFAWKLFTENFGHADNRIDAATTLLRFAVPKYVFSLVARRRKRDSMSALGGS